MCACDQKNHKETKSTKTENEEEAKVNAESQVKETGREGGSNPSKPVIFDFVVFSCRVSQL